MVIRYKGHPSWRSAKMWATMLKATGASAAFGVVMAALAHQQIVPKALAVVGTVAFAAVAFSIAEAVRRTTVYIITNRSVQMSRGILKRESREFHIQKVQAVDVEQTLFERLVLKVGTVSFGSAATDIHQEEIRFEGVANPYQVADIARRAEDEYGSRHYDPADRYQQVPGYPQGGSSSGSYHLPPPPPHR